MHSKKIEFDLFEKKVPPLEVKYGLPKDVKFCSRCVVSNQRPNSAVEYKHTIETKKETIFFDENNVCDACHFAEKKASIKWEEREKELKELCDRFRKNDGSYDCLVPGSGGKDSFYAAHMLKYKYGMHPLTVTWAPHIYTDWGWRNLQSWIHAGFDNYLCTPNGMVHRLLTRLAVENLYHPFQPFIIGQKSFAPQMAMRFGIKLVFFGENEAEYGNPIKTAETPVRDSCFFTSSNLNNLNIAGVSVTDLKSVYGFTNNDLYSYLPSDINMLVDAGIEVRYLGYYLRWHPQRCYYYAVENGGFEACPERNPGTYSKYTSLDDRIDDLHFYTTYIKFGIGRATYDAAQEIRSGDITREEGVALVKRFDGEFPERFIEELFKYLSIDEKHFPHANKAFEQPMMDRDYFMHLADKFRSPHLWYYDHGVWKLRHAVWQDQWAGSISQEEEGAGWSGNKY